MSSLSDFFVLDFDPITLELVTERQWGPDAYDQDIPWRDQAPAPLPDLGDGWPVVNQGSASPGDYRSTMGVVGTVVAAAGAGRADYAILYNEEAVATYTPDAPDRTALRDRVVTWYTQDGYAITWSPDDYAVVAFWATTQARNRPPDTAKALASYSQGFFRGAGR